MTARKQATLLVELLTEELPPKALPRLGETFAGKIAEGLKARGLADAGAGFRWFASPRRIAIVMPGVLDQAEAQEVTEKLMPVSVALDAEGKPTPALRKKMEAKGIPAEAVAGFERRLDGKAEALFHTATVAGAQLAQVLAGIVQDAVKALPIPKVMRWGDGEATFVRPVHKLVMLHGADVVPGRVLDLDAGRTTRGHRFMSRGDIDIATAEAYEPTLLAEGKVVPDFAERRADIERQLLAEAARLGAQLGEHADLLDEVSALVEHPTVYVGEFEAEFLAVPQECLILTMQANQKYFPLFDAAGKLQNRFLIVSNMRVSDPANIVSGNARVVRPRLSDARFFFETDKKHKLDSRLPRLGNVVYHNKLGSVLERVERLEALAGRIAARLGADEAAARRAARLAKADLVTEMVGEFPELQGIMGRYYALADGEGEVVADAIQAHYQPRFAGDALPAGNIAAAVALADKLDALAGFFGIGLVPTGDKDPFALRRAALGVLRILIETPLPLALDELIDEAAAGFKPGLLSVEGHRAQLLDFLFERLRHLLRGDEQQPGHAPDVIDAVLALRPARIDLVPVKLDAVRAFRALPEAEALAAANKRIVNILKKAEGTLGEPDIALLQEAAEKALFHRVVEVAPLVRSHVDNEDYADALCVLAGLRAEVDRFFEEVMVMAEEPLTRANRLALLNQLAGLMNRVADISRLSA
ncbi:glycine--tRNA ligase subunit beta [Pseudothauera nasutitermitis]|uniref:Glycine--tRNA ligase beta subunit n=1 Tax=Pseudothauera nasutitermitis TaxID=2565930 RepID=A0A4V3WBM1_9RHOO|nr:glycine--tRNA ligase subunit beta [Pseudothauera nasutitermitis]THF63773.1 glycine--tRNA ligase subunit beta [Pseudothauera nasutitermitis]